MDRQKDGTPGGRRHEQIVTRGEVDRLEQARNRFVATSASGGGWAERWDGEDKRIDRGEKQSVLSTAVVVNALSGRRGLLSLGGTAGRQMDALSNI